ncbi:MAG TPA: transcriptional repressor [Syntrophorhabdales bacterium]|nr:transcriptional repressor [Syntrophorhabdales bacterium]
MKKKGSKELPVLEGRRRTAGRREVLAAIVEMKGHFDPQTLHERLKAKGSKVSRASLYRTIPILLEQGIITEVQKTEKHSHYEKTNGKAHHDHLICLSCGRTIEFYSPTIEMLQDEICNREAFKGIRHTLEIMGYCKKCISK